MATIQLSSAQRSMEVEPAPQAIPAPRVVVVNAAHRFGRRAVLKGVDLHISPGEIYGLLGPNGAGKTTLMRAMCGRLQLDRGTVRIDGEDPRINDIARGRIGFVPQDIALYSYLTVRENLAVFARLAGVAHADIPATIERALGRTGLTARAGQLCRSLSGGYQRRVNICASILHGPGVLVLDEPTVGIDIDAREEIHTLLLDLRRQGTAILLTTHDLEQAQTLCDRVGILKAGRFVVEGRPAELLRRKFSGQTELIALLGKVDAPRAEVLRQLGLMPAASPNTWVCLAPPDVIDLPAISRRLVAVGVNVKELRIREPDLTTLFLAALQEDVPAAPVPQ